MENFRIHHPEIKTMKLKGILLLQTLLIGILIFLVARLYWKLPEENQPKEPDATQTAISRQSDSIVENPAQVDTIQRLTPEPIVKSPHSHFRVQEETPPAQLRPLPNEEEKKYYSNGKLSVRISPWKEGRRYWKLYDLYGNETIELEEVRLSYTVSYDARFHENGAVSVIHFSENPGAANFWYEGEMEFSTTNEPITRRVRKMPYESLEEMSRRAWQYWDKRSGTWKEQEVMEGVPD